MGQRNTEGLMWRRHSVRWGMCVCVCTHLQFLWLFCLFFYWFLTVLCLFFFCCVCFWIYLCMYKRGYYTALVCVPMITCLQYTCQSHAGSLRCPVTWVLCVSSHDAPLSYSYDRVCHDVYALKAVCAVMGINAFRHFFWDAVMDMSAALCTYRSMHKKCMAWLGIGMF